MAPPPAPPAAAGATEEMRASDEDIFVDAPCQAGGRAGGRAGVLARVEPDVAGWQCAAPP